MKRYMYIAMLQKRIAFWIPTIGNDSCFKFCNTTLNDLTKTQKKTAISLHNLS